MAVAAEVSAGFASARAATQPCREVVSLEGLRERAMFQGAGAPFVHEFTGESPGTSGDGYGLELGEILDVPGLHPVDQTLAVEYGFVGGGDFVGVNEIGDPTGDPYWLEILELRRLDKEAKLATQVDAERRQANAGEGWSDRGLELVADYILGTGPGPGRVHAPLIPLAFSR